MRRRHADYHVVDAHTGRRLPGEPSYELIASSFGTKHLYAREHKGRWLATDGLHATHTVSVEAETLS